MTNVPEPKPHERVRSAMQLKGYTHNNMAKSIGLSFSTFNLKINGKRDFSLPECNRIAARLGKTLDELFFAPDVSK